MSEQKPYEEFPDQQFNDLPLPDMEESWQQMSQLLDEDDDKDRILPPIFLSCAGWGLFGLLLLGGLWFVFHPEHWWKKKETAQQQEKVQTSKPTLSNENKPFNRTVTVQKEEQEARKDQVIKDSTTGISTGSAISLKENHIATSGTDKSYTEKEERTSYVSGGKKYIATKNRSISKKKKYNEFKDGKSHLTTTKNRKHKVEVSDQVTTSSLDNQKQETNDKDSSVVQNNITSNTIVKQDTSNQKKDTTDKQTDKDQTKPKKKAQKIFYVSAGVGLQQQIPLNGQKAVPYNYYGRTGSLSDYIPSVYVRLEQDKKWFVQGEFRYGAPQSVKEVAYSSVSKSDSFNVFSITTTLRVKKTYYHQLPISFNYYILPNWSVGTGLLYSRFHGAVTEQEVKKRNNITQTESIISTKIMTVPANTDSFFTTSQMQVLLQSEYQWKRFSFGLRYTKGIQPYIRYTDTNGELKEEKDMSLQLYVRFRLICTRIGKD